MQICLNIFRIDRYLNALLIALFFLSNTLAATSAYSGDLVLSWAKSLGGVYYDSGNSILVDDSGYVYASGDIADTDGVFIHKMDHNGHLIWGKTISGTLGGQAYMGEISVDDFGNVYIIGGFYGSIVFSDGEVRTSIGDDVFINKLDSYGNIVWIKTLSGLYSKHAPILYSSSICTDDTGNVYITGRFYESIDFGDGKVRTSNGKSDIFISKLDSNGKIVWAKTYGGPSYDRGNGYIDDSGNVYITGTFYESIDFGDGKVRTSNGKSDIFISKLDSNGKIVWAKTYGGPDNETCNGYIDDTGNVYITGGFYESIDFGDGKVRTSNGDKDVFTSKLDSNGKIVWAKTYGGPYYDCGTSIFADDSDNVYTTETFTIDMFIRKLDIKGHLVWVTSIGGEGAFVWGNSIFVDGSDHVYIIGEFEGSVDFDPSSREFYLDSLGGHRTDIFIIKLINPGPYKLSVSLSGLGKVTSNPSGISCPSNCSEMYENGTSVTLKAIPSKGAIFGSWSGGKCKVSGTTCTVIMDRDKKVTASFGKKGGIPWSMLLLNNRE